MPYKDNEVRRAKQAEYSARYYLANKEKVQLLTNKNKRETRAKWQQYKGTLCCAKCGQNHPSTLDFHHVNKDDKRSVNQLASGGRYKDALEETKKCIVLCANCHRIHHHEERQLKKVAKKKK